MNTLDTLVQPLELYITKKWLILPKEICLFNIRLITSSICSALNFPSTNSSYSF
jgi:hypothetical protein